VHWLLEDIWASVPAEVECILLLLVSERQVLCFCSFGRMDVTRGLEPWIRERARQYRVAGGKTKGPSKLTDPQRIDSRKYVSSIACVSLDGCRRASSDQYGSRIGSGQNQFPSQW